MTILKFLVYKVKANFWKIITAIEVNFEKLPWAHFLTKMDELKKLLSFCEQEMKCYSMSQWAKMNGSMISGKNMLFSEEFRPDLI